MVKRRTGLDPLSYMGVEPSMPAQFVRESRNPTTNDYDGFNIGTVWIVRGTNAVWMLVDKANFIATWRQFEVNLGGVNTLTGDVGGAVPPTANNINIFGGDHFVFTGNPGASTLTLTSDGTVAAQFDADAGSAIPAAGILNIIGAAGLTTAGAGNTITITPGGAVAVQIDTDVGGPVVPVAGVLEVFGGNNITTTGAGNRVTADLTGTTDNAVQRGNAGGSLTSMPLGTDGQVIIGATGAAPLFATMTSAGGTILFTPGANTLNLETAAAPVTINCDVGSATVAAGVLNLTGGDNISTTGAGNTMTVAVSGTANFNPQMGNASGSLSDIGTMTDGDLVIGSTGVAPQVSTLTAGTGIGIVNGPGSITISATGSSADGVKVTEFLVSGTWTKDANAKTVLFIVYSAGGGGGGGGRFAPNKNTSGGGAGAFRGMTGYMIPADRLGATENVTIGAGGAGGAAQTVDDTQGNSGGGQSVTSFGTSFPIIGGDPRDLQTGLGFNIASGGRDNFIAGGGRGGANYYYLQNMNLIQLPWIAFNGQPGAAGSGNGSFGSNTFIMAPTYGGGGGGINTSNVAFAGGDGQTLFTLTHSTGGSTDFQIGTAAPGGAAGVSGTNGQDATAINSPFATGGYGGGGGGAHITNPGDGGDGGFPGGTGAGGGTCQNGNNSGAGGDGADGVVVIYEYLGS